VTDSLSRLRRFLRELKRRNVYRVAATYLVAAFVVLQLASLAADAFGFPGWFEPMVWVVAGLGFPLALILAWAFELSPDGVRRTPGAPPSRPTHDEAETAGEERSPSPDTRPDRRETRFAIRVFAALGVLAAAATGAWYLVGGGGDAGTPATGPTAAGERATEARATDDRPRVLVRPLENRASDSGNASFARGMHDALQSQLDRVSGLEVLSRNTGVDVEEAGMSVAEIARKHDVRAILDGSVNRAGDRLRVTAFLTDARRNEQVWSENYRREYSVDALFDIQADIARSIASALETELTAGDRSRIADAPTGDRDAFEAYLQGKMRAMDAYNRQDLTPVDPAVRHLREAIRRDSTFAEARAWLGLAYSARSYLGGEERWRDSALAAVDRALTLDSELPDAHSVRGLLHQIGEPDRAEQAYRRALELDPNHWLAADGMADLAAFRGNWAQALDWAHRVVRINPRGEWGLAYFGTLLRLTGHHDAAAAWLRDALEMNPENAGAVSSLARLHLSRGETGAARETVEAYRSTRPDHPAGLELAAELALRRGDAERAVALLHRIPREDRTQRNMLSTSPRVLLGLAELHAGRRDRGRALLANAADTLRHWLEANSEAPWRLAHLGLSRVLAALERPDDALRHLGQAADAGVIHHRGLLVSPFFEDLRSDPHFRKILRRMEARQTEVRARVRNMGLDLYPPGVDADTVDHSSPVDG